MRVGTSQRMGRSIMRRCVLDMALLGESFWIKYSDINESGREEMLLVGCSQDSS